MRTCEDGEAWDATLQHVGKRRRRVLPLRRRLDRLQALPHEVWHDDHRILQDRVCGDGLEDGGRIGRRCGRGCGVALVRAAAAAVAAAVAAAMSRLASSKHRVVGTLKRTARRR